MSNQPIQKTPWLLHTKEELRPYRRYPKLMGEMKYASNFPETPFRFLDLPIELRLQVYREALVLENPIEVWPETLTWRRNYHCRNNVVRHYEKLIRSEALEVFYKENEFRFSGINGPIVACMFMSTVRPKAYQWLKSLTIAMPFWTLPMEDPHDGSESIYSLDENVASMSSADRLNSMVPFRSFKGGVQFYDNACRFLFKMLARTQLKTLRLVLPSVFRPVEFPFESTQQGRKLRRMNNQKAIWKVLQRLVTAKPSLEVEVVYLHVEETDSPISISEPNRRLLKDLRNKLGIWKIHGAVPNAKGNWTITERVDDGIPPEAPLMDIRFLFEPASE